MENNYYTIVREESSDMRAIAREALKGNWVKGLIATFVYLLLFQVVTAFLEFKFPTFPPEMGVNFSFASSLYQLFTTGAFTLGYVTFCLALLRRKPASPVQIFEGFEHIFKATLLTILIGIFVLLWTMLFIIPGIIAAFRYSQAYNILHDHPEYGVMQCINESKKMMNGNKAKFFVFMLSYIGWILLVFVPVGVMVAVLAGTGNASTENYSMIMLAVQLFTVIISVPLTLYMSMGEMVFYDIAAGNLVKQKIEVQPISTELEMPLDPIVAGANAVRTGETKEPEVEVVDAEIVGQAEDIEKVVDVEESELK